MEKKPAVDQGAWLLGLEQGPYSGRWFRVDFHVCPNPCCDCGVVGFRCSSAEQPGLPMKFDLEIFDRRLQPWEPQDPEGVALGKAFMAEAGDPQWLVLRGLFLEAKRRQMENMDLDELQVQFPIEADGGGGFMFGYGEIFPWVEGLEFEHDSGRWLADDQYCVRPECDCAETALAFYELSAGSSESGGLRAKCAVFYGYRSGDLKLIEQTSASPKPALLVGALRGVKPDLNATLERRHQQLKQLARRLLPSSSRTAPGYPKGTRGDPSRPTDVGSEDQPVIAEKKPGRNAPCPCGSGKKYKRCCGAA